MRKKEKGPPVWQGPAATLEHEVSKDSRGRTEVTSFFHRKVESEALRNIINKLSEERNLRDLHLEHYHMSSGQFKKRTTHLDIPGHFYDMYQRGEDVPVMEPHHIGQPIHPKGHLHRKVLPSFMSGWTRSK